MLNTERHYTTTHFHHFKSIVLLINVFFVSFVLRAQVTETKILAEELSKSSEIKAYSPQIIYTQIRRKLHSDADFEKFEIQKGQEKIFLNYNVSSIDRSYVVNNPFDMEDLDNPFNLTRPGVRANKKINKNNSEDIQKFFVTLFEYRQMPKKTIINKKPELVAPSWMLFSLISLLSVFAYQLVAFKSENKKTLQGFVSNSSALQQFRDQKTILNPYQLITDSLFILTLGHFIHIGINTYLHSIGMETNWSFSSLLLSILSVAGLHSLKSVQSKVLGWVFPFKQALNYNHFLLNNNFRVLALLITPLLFFLTYSPESVKIFTLYTSLFCIAISGLYSFFRMTLASSELILENKFHFFIYLCGVEIAPLLILLKLLTVI